MTSNLISMVRDLQRRKGRKRRGLAIAEGIRIVEEALAAGVTMRGAIVTPGLDMTPRGAALVANLAAHAVPMTDVSERQLVQLSDTDTPQGVLAVVEPPRWSLADIEPRARAPVLVLDSVQDPGNVGTLLRTGAALGAVGAVMLKGTADLANPKVIRAAMGATFRFPTAPADEAEFITWAARQGLTVWATGIEGSPLARLTVPERLALVVGNEGAGVRPALRSVAEHQVTLPLARGAESLNVAVATGIFLYEVTRAT
ncbi:MAG: RNA methyltransferase [Gemmatimonadales bacterium]